MESPGRFVADVVQRTQQPTNQLATQLTNSLSPAYSLTKFANVAPIASIVALAFQRSLPL